MMWLYDIVVSEIFIPQTGPKNWYGVCVWRAWMTLTPRYPYPWGGGAREGWIIYIYTYIYIHIYTYIYTYIYDFIHTQLYTHIYRNLKNMENWNPITIVMMFFYLFGGYSTIYIYIYVYIYTSPHECYPISPTSVSEKQDFEAEGAVIRREFLWSRCVQRHFQGLPALDFRPQHIVQYIQYIQYIYTYTHIKSHKYEYARI